MLCGGSRRVRKKDNYNDAKGGLQTPSSFRSANTSMAKLRELTDRIFDPNIMETAPSGEEAKYSDQKASKELYVPRSIRWTLGLSKRKATAEGLQELMSRRKEQRANYLKMARELDPHQSEPLLSVKVEGKEAASGEDGDPNAELKRSIKKDVERTYQDMEFFNSKTAKSILSRILLVWCCKCGAMGYRQGMNELLAVCIMAVKMDADKCRDLDKNKKNGKPQNNDTKENGGEENLHLSEKATRVRAETRDFLIIPEGLCDPSPRMVEADAFSLFRLLMQKMSPLYHSHARDGRSFDKAAPEDGGGDGGKSGGGAPKKQPHYSSSSSSSSSEKKSEGGIGSGSLKTPLDRHVYRVHHVMLRRLDPKLYFRLEGFGVLPQLYMLRWLRLLFARETAQLNQLMVLLDALLGDSNGFDLIDYVCLAMIAGMRESLLKLGADPSFVLTTLLRRGAIKNAKALIHAAQVLKEDKLLTRPAPAKMQVYNSPLQGNGNRLGLGSKPGHLEIKRTPMEGYVVGVKSQTLYWCVLDGPRLLWYAEPTRRTTVAQTWLDGCRIIGLGNGVLEIQSPSSPATSTSAIAKKVASGDESEEETVQNAPPLHTSDGVDAGGEKEEGETEEEKKEEGLAAAANAPNNRAATDASNAEVDVHPTPALCVVDNTAPPAPAAPTKVVVAVPAVQREGGGGDGSSDDVSKGKDVVAAASSPPVRMSVRLEVKDEMQYQQWLQCLKEATMYSLRDRSLWRKCFR
mmetsp:Transcript_37878/g.61577  ORF Transcript_37878/g.61577 Transcript_37878/m.61577 type:complete len:744 (+) Transcript_37878:45-2276(+)